MNSLALFDIDNTLIKSSKTHRAAFITGIKKYTINAGLEECMNVIAGTFTESVEGEKLIVLEGVRSLLRELKDLSILMGLVTGNLEPIARVKF